MAAILRLKLADGSWVEIPSIVGPKGPKGDRGITGAYIGSDMPTDPDINIWIDPNGEPTSTEEWEFSLDDGSIDNRTVVVLDSEENTDSGKTAVLRIKQADGTWVEIPALKGKALTVVSVEESSAESGSNVVTFSDGTKLIVKNGPKGDRGVSPTVSIVEIEGGHRITVTDASGTNSINVMNGETGRGIKTVARTNGNGSPGTTDTYTITYTDNTTSTFAIYHGKDGVSLAHSWNGTALTISSASGSSTVDLKGEKGDPGTGVTILGSYDTESALKSAHPTGNPGDAYLVGGYLYVWSATKSNWDNVGQIQGPKGDPGASITVTSVTESSEDGGSNVITLSDGTTITIKNGKSGKNGDPGYTPKKGTDYHDGVSPTVTVDEITGGHRITIVDATSTRTIDVMDGVKGDTGKGIKSVARTSGNGASGTVDTYTITFTDDTTTTFAVYNGRDGKDGSGADGKTAYEYAKAGGFAGTEEEFSIKLATEHLPLNGGTMMGELRVNGKDVAGGSKIVLETGKGQITNSGTQTLFGFIGETTLAMGHSSYAVNIRGNATRPLYNNKDMALLSDVDTKANKSTITVDATSGEKSITLTSANSNTEWRYVYASGISKLTLASSGTFANNAEAYYSIIFLSGTTATTITNTLGAYFTGDDCVEGVLTPSASKTYDVGIYWNGIKWQAVVRGV